MGKQAVKNQIILPIAKHYYYMLRICLVKSAPMLLILQKNHIPSTKSNASTHKIGAESAQTAGFVWRIAPLHRLQFPRYRNTQLRVIFSIAARTKVPCQQKQANCIAVSNSQSPNAQEIGANSPKAIGSVQGNI